jgi:hypothetical protein
MAVEKQKSGGCDLGWLSLGDYSSYYKQTYPNTFEVTYVNYPVDKSIQQVDCSIWNAKRYPESHCSTFRRYIDPGVQTQTMTATCCRTDVPI